MTGIQTDTLMTWHPEHELEALNCTLGHKFFFISIKYLFSPVAGSGKQKPGSVVTTVGPATARNVSCTALLYFNNGGKVTTDATWTVNFTCGTSEDCPQTVSSS